MLLKMAARSAHKKIYPTVEIELEGPEVQTPYQQIQTEDRSENETDPVLLKVGILIVQSVSNCLLSSINL